MRSFLVALAFLTILPIHFKEMPSEEDVARSRFWYPAVGVLLGALLGGWTALVAQFTTALVGAFLVLVAWVGVTGALHVDGLCDLCDGLFGGHTPEERLRIMKDPHAGTFGVVAIVLLLLGKFVLLNELIGRQGMLAGWPIASAVVVGRCLVLHLAAGMRYPRPDGTGKAFIEAARPIEALVCRLAAAGMALLALPTGEMGRWGGVFCWPYIAALVVRLTCRHRLGGITGDGLGAGIELAELGVLFGAVVMM